MADGIPFDRSRPEPGRLYPLSPLVRRWVVPNPGPFTFTGTCCYVAGRGRVAVIDPGPGQAGEAEALLAALGDETVADILVTHTHRDHSPGARRLQALTGAPISGCAPHWAARSLAAGEQAMLDASADRGHRPDRLMQEGDSLDGAGFRLIALATPGHTMNHLCFALPEDNALFSGDHVMAWSTSIVAPPDGSMASYMASLEKLRGRPEAIFWPGHGGPVTDPPRFVRALLGHRRMREASILAAIRAGTAEIPSLVDQLYEGLAPQLKGAAALSVYAHLEDLVAQGQVRTDGPPSLTGHYRSG
ncbi:MAG: MBL fold metallo-hydrolase [Methylocystis sp.]|nr:MBL fold metallo-hydrolase [Methylocystis sp.]MCA3583298.1 MBL fold metallo-hydrolase [Methylocystis sp.]MCA3588083.1 MBL fold metallo-hydrolase [Methylocystis sp.]MCA3591475.1 MBL fold metallo-hydrolase [Methylocystis sp.]